MTSESKKYDVQFQMSQGEVMDFLKLTIPLKRPVLLVGPVGCGKSEMVAQSVEYFANQTQDPKQKYELMISHPVTDEPIDYKGLGWVVNESGQNLAKWIPYQQLDYAMKVDHPLVWFLDDLGPATPATKAALMQLILARRIGEHKLSDHVTFVAATNRRRDKSAVTGIVNALIGRFDVVEIQPLAQDWITWALANDLPEVLIGAVDQRPEWIENWEASNEMVNSPNARNITSIVPFLDIQNVSFRRKALSTRMGYAAANELNELIRLKNELPTLQQIVSNPLSVQIPKDRALIFMLVTMLVRNLTKQNNEAVNQFIVNRISDEFMAVFMKQAVKRYPNLTGYDWARKWMLAESSNIMNAN